MLKKKIVYTDYDGNERTEEFYFNLTKAEIAELELMTPGGFSEAINKAVAEKNAPEIAKIFKEMILKSYGVKSADGRRFIKTKEVVEEFSQTEAFSTLYIELATDAKAAAEFFNGIVPKA